MLPLSEPDKHRQSEVTHRPSLTTWSAACPKLKQMRHRRAAVVLGLHAGGEEVSQHVADMALAALVVSCTRIGYTRPS
jgi:hypothetical protein